MTDLLTHTDNSTATPAQHHNNTVLSPIKANFSQSNVPPPHVIEEDDSTIKCICGFKDDDGSSVQCEKCETWQHTVCYYYDEENDRVLTDELAGISHFCADCSPRTLDVHSAIARQRARIGGFGLDDKKAKKAPSKSHKKKAKAIETNGVLTNGCSPDGDGLHDRTSRSPRDALPANKKTKTHHRSSQSLGLSALSQSHTSHPHKRSASALQSPTKTAPKHALSHFIKGQYSDLFMRLYDDDPGDQSLHTNLFSNISITKDLSIWAFDVDALYEATRGFSHADVFHRIEQPLENIMGLSPRKESREEARVTIDGRHPRWRYLTSDGFTKKNTIVGELKGEIGHMNDYISDPNNRWPYLRHPAPFVFFHPKLPIYIDTRSKGTTCRYLRRSCRPNLSMTTFLENESEYHFCFTAKEDIEPGAELTIGWTPDEHMRKFSSNKNDMAQDLGADGEDYVIDWVGKVSPEFGGCACGIPESCWLVRYDPEFRPSVKGKGAQVRRRPHMNAHDSSDVEDETSTSRSDSGSRALTPTGPQASVTVLGLDISEREKRKIALLEKNLENDKYQPANKRKKRNSGGSSAHPLGSGPAQKPSTHNSSSISLPNTPGFPIKPQYVDASTSGRKSGSPIARNGNGFERANNNAQTGPKTNWSNSNTPTFHSPLRANYVSTGVQTEPDAEGDWFLCAQPTTIPRKPFMSMTKRLLLRSRRDRQISDERRRSAEACLKEEATGSQAYTADSAHRPELVQTDVAMLNGDQPAIARKVETGSSHLLVPTSNHAEARPPPWPRKDQEPAVNESSDTGLRLQLPSKPMQAPNALSGTAITHTPPSAIPQSSFTQPISPHLSLQPPLSGGVNPSPAKKKVSLSEYMKRKTSSSTEGKTGVSSPETTHRPLRSPQPRMHTDSPLEGSNIDTPSREESNPLESGLDPTKVAPRAQDETKRES